MSLSLNKKFHDRLEELTGLLIKHLTGFQVKSSNYESCMKFALSQFFHHRFISVDRHKVNKEILGLVETYQIHCEYIKSEKLRKLYHVYLSQNLSSVSFSDSEVHYSILSLILKLSESSVEFEYVEEVKENVLPDTEDDIDWPTYLLEGIDLPPIWESSSDEDDFLSISSISQETKPEQTIEQSLQISNEIKYMTLTTRSDVEVIEPNLVPEYWKNTKRSSESVRLKSICSLKSYRAYPVGDTLTEQYLMREIIWLLGGHSDLFVFDWKDGHFTVSDKAFLVHLSSLALSNQLESVTRHATNLYRIQKYFDTSKQLCLTYEAFSTSIESYINNFHQYLVQLEMKIIQVKETYLLEELLTDLNEHFYSIDLITNIYKMITLLDESENNISEKVSHLLHVLYNALINEYTSHRGGHHPSVDVMLTLWINTIKPYIDFIDNWLTKGQFIDLKNEFAVCRQEQTISSDASKSWQDLIKPKTLDAVSWIDPIFQSLVAGGRSMEILKTLNDVSIEFRRSINVHLQNLYKENKISIFDTWIRNLEAQDVIICQRSSKTNKTNSQTVNVAADVFLSAAFKPNHTEFHFEKTPIYQIASNSISLPTLICKSLYPLIKKKSNDVSSSLLMILDSQCGLNNVLNNYHDIHLLGWGDVVHDFSFGIFKIFQENSLQMSHHLLLNIILQDALAAKISSSSQLFNQINIKINMSSLNQNLQSSSLVDSKILHQYDCIEINQEIAWPLHLAITPESRDMYNRIFRYLMKIKHSIFSLESLHISSIYSESLQYPDDVIADDTMPIREKLHRFALLRFRMLQFLKHWQSFVMISVISGQKKSFDEERKTARDFEDLVLIHRRFLHRIITLCLLNDQDKNHDRFVHEILMRVITLAVSFHRTWSRGIHYVGDQCLKKQENIFKECSEFFGQILKSIAKRRSFPILETLAHSILS